LDELASFFALILQQGGARDTLGNLI